MKFITVCVKRPVSVIMALAAVLLAGVFAFSALPLERLPEISYPKVVVETVYPGLGAEEVRSIITIPVEDALSSVKGLKRLRSVSRDGSSVVVMDFRWGTNPAAVSVLVREAIDTAYTGLPEGCRKPIVVPGDPSVEAHAIVAVHSKKGDTLFERRLAEYDLRSRFRRIDGVGAVNLAGGDSAEAHVVLDLPKAVSAGLGPTGVAQALSSEAADIPAGNAREADKEVVIVSAGRPASVAELSKIVLPSQNGGFRLTDLAEVKESKARKKSIFIYNGEEQTALEIYRQAGADPVKLSKDIRDAIGEADFSNFSKDIDIRLVYDASASIVGSAKSLGLSASLGAAAVILTLLLFMGRIRYSLLAALSIPVSAAASVAVLALAHRSLNGMSLSGLSIGIGLVSDTSVIVLDLLHRSFGHRKTRPGAEETGSCVSSVSVSCLAATITTAVVFVPVVFLPGPLGALFGDLSISLVTSITMGWLYAQFMLPSLYRQGFRQEPPQTSSPQTAALPHTANSSPHTASSHSPSHPNVLLLTYSLLLKKNLRRPQRVFLAACVLCAIGAILLFNRPMSFVSKEAASEIEARLEFPAGASLEAMGPEAARVSAELSQIPEIAAVFGRAGAEDDDLGPRSDPDFRKESLVLRCLLKKDAKADEILPKISEKLEDAAVSSNIPGLAAMAGYPQDKTEKLLGLSSAYTVAVKGSSRAEVKERANDAARRLAATGRAAAITLRPSGTRPELRVSPNREAAAYIGASGAGIAQSLYTATEGSIPASLEIAGRPLDVRVLSNPPTPLEAMPIAQTGNGILFLGAVAKIERREAEARLARLDRSDAIYLDAIPAPEGSGGWESRLENSARGTGQKNGEPANRQSVSLSKSMGYLAKTMDGVSRADESAFTQYRSSLILTVIVVIFLLYMTMAAQFESFSLPAILMLSIPFSIAGVGPGLLLAQTGLDSGAVVGLVVLFGLVVNNGIVLYEISNKNMKKGLSPAQAVFSGAQDRVRPILITTLTTIFSLLPLAITPLGSSQKSMSAAMLGGLIASTLLSLFALPTLFVGNNAKQGRLC